MSGKGEVIISLDEHVPPPTDGMTRQAAKVARLRNLPTDPQGGYRPDAYYDITMGTFYISRKF